MAGRIVSALAPAGAKLKPPFVLRLVNAIPMLQGLTARLLGIGVRPEHVRSPEA